MEYPIVKPVFLSGSTQLEAVENSETVPLLRFATQEKERPNGRSASYARIQREGASAPPAPTPRKYKNKNWLGMVGLVQPCTKV